LPALRPPLSATVNKTYRWLLSLTIGGREVRLCTGGPVTITGKDGEVYEFVGGLSPTDYERSLDLWNQTPSPRSQSFEIFLEWDLALQVARGVPLYAATGELAQWYEGTAWEERRVVLRGNLSEPAYGALGEAIFFALTENPVEDRASIPPAGWTVAEGTTFTESGNIGPDPGVVGAVYPLVIGAPGQVKTTGTTSSTYSEDTPGTPALLVKRDSAGGTTLTDYTILIAGGRVETSSIKIVNTSDTSKTFTTSSILNSTDGLGQPYTYVTPDVSGNIPSEGDGLYAIWDPADGGGVTNHYGTGGLRGAGDVIRWALAQSTLRVDHSRLGQLKTLNSFKIDGFINQPISPWEWVASNVLPLLPVSVATGPDGLYVAPWLHKQLQKDQAIVTLEEGRNATRIGNVVYTSSDSVVNDITLRFGLNASTGSHAVRRTIHGEKWTSSDPDSRPDFWCRRSRAVFDKRALELTTNVIYDVATAESILAYYARRYTFPQREILYTVPREYDWLRPGDVLLLVDSDLHLSEVIGLVGPIAYGEDSLTVQVVLYEPLVFAG